MTHLAPRTRLRQILTLSLLFAAGAVNFFDRVALSVANTTIRVDLHLDATAMGWLLSAFSLAYGLAQLPLVPLLRRTGTRAALGAGLGLWSAAQLGTAFVRGLPSFLLFRVLLGVGESPFYPAGVGAVREWFSARTRGRATACMSMSQTLSLAAAPPVLTWLLLRYGWRSMFALLGLAGLLVAVAWIALYRSGAAFPAGSPQPAHSPSPWTQLLRQRTVWGMMLGFGGINYTNWLYTAWMPAFLQQSRHLSLARTGLLAAIPFLAGALGMLLSGLLADALVRRGTPLPRVHRSQIVAGMVLSALGTLAVIHAPSTAAAVAGLSCTLGFIHFAGTSAWGYAQAVVRADLVASVCALQNFASFLIASLGPVLTGFLLDRTHSFSLALGVCSTVTALGAISYAVVARPPGKLSLAGDLYD